MLAAAQPVTLLFQLHLWVLRVRVQISLGEKISPQEASLSGGGDASENQGGTPNS